MSTMTRGTSPGGGRMSCWAPASGTMLKVLRKRATFISLATAPYFYALSENYGEPGADYLLQYEEGRLTWEAKAIYEALWNDGPLDTISLRRAARLTSRASDSPFNRGLEFLQADFKILPVAVAEAGAWHYAYAYDVVARFYPDLPAQAREVRQAAARRRLAELYLRSVGAAQPWDLLALFGWPRPDVELTIEALAEDGVAARGLAVDARSGEWIALTELCR